jgi:TrmH family RNA methyltransferase
MITSTRNPRIKWVRSLQSRRRARREGAFVIEGVRLAGEALTAGAQVSLVLHTQKIGGQEAELIGGLAGLGAEVQEVAEHVMEACSSVETSPGLLVVLPQIDMEAPDDLSLALVVDRMSDPGNLGTLLRSAEAAGVQAVFLTEDTVDAYNPKVVRGAMGAHFRLPVVSTTVADLPERLSGLEVWLAEAGAGEAYDQADWRGPVAVIIGGEAHGPRPEVRALASGSVHVPMREGAESLNAAVAAGVVLFEIARQRGAA